MALWALFDIDSLRMVFSLLLLFLFLPSIAASSSLLSSSSTFLSVSLLLREEEPIPGNPVMVLLRVYITVPVARGGRNMDFGMPFLALFVFVYIIVIVFPYPERALTVL